jgi:hypothetical protein
MDTDHCRLSRPIHRPFGDGDQIEVADSSDVVAEFTNDT